MLTIAICDDEMVFAEQLKDLIYMVNDDMDEDVTIDIYSESIKLCDSIDNGQEYDMVFLDIAMPGANGIDVGRYIRDVKEDNITQIIYVSSDRSYAMDLFKIRPMDFLIKPVSTGEVEKVIKTAVKLINNSDKLFVFSVRGENYRIPHKDILYICSYSRKIVIYTKDREYEYYGKIDEAIKNLKSDSFVRISKSCIINYMYVKKISAKSVTMINGEELSVSRDRKEELRQICRM